ncbi:MAG: right-handed parallel beta-helix repeat-containing protein [Pseudomonadota bacterium]|nr:right-handed parallel beta-helix repeat-containing protein [Pseudomonadota bacterium]
MTALTVGAGQQFMTVAAAVAVARPGDTVQIQGGTYTNDFPVAINGLAIEGVDGQVRLVATRQPPNAKAYLDVVGGNTTLRNLDISGVTVPDQVGAGVRCEGGSLTLDHVHLHGNENGLFGTYTDPSAHVTIHNSEIDHNGVQPTVPGAVNSHNIYIAGAIGIFALSGSYVHDANVGHEVKSRAENTIIENNRIFDNQGTSSYSIDLPQGGDATIAGNVIEQSPNGQNPTIIAYGEESSVFGARAGTSVTFTGNTVVNDMTAHAPRLFWNTGGKIGASNNTLYGITPAQLGMANFGFAFTAARPELDTNPHVTASSRSAPPSDADPRGTDANR